MHHQAEVNFEKFTEVKFRDILLTGTGHRDRRLSRDSPGQTGTYGRSNFNQNLKPKPNSNFRFIRERPFAIPSFHQKFRPGAFPPPHFVGALLQIAGQNFQNSFSKCRKQPGKLNTARSEKHSKQQCQREQH